MPVAKVALWEWVLGKCKEVGYGRLTITVIVHKGLPVQVELERVRESFREEQARSGKEELIV